MKIEIVGLKTPSGKNAVTVTRSGLRFPTKRFKTWREAAALQVKQQWRGEAYTQPVRATIEYTPGDLIRRDADGILSALWHLLGYCGIVQDDALIQQVDYRQQEIDRVRPRVTIALEKICPAIR